MDEDGRELPNHFVVYLFVDLPEDWYIVRKASDVLGLDHGC